MSNDEGMTALHVHRGNQGKWTQLGTKAQVIIITEHEPGGQVQLNTRDKWFLKSDMKWEAITKHGEADVQEEETGNRKLEFKTENWKEEAAHDVVGWLADIWFFFKHFQVESQV